MTTDHTPDLDALERLLEEAEIELPLSTRQVWHDDIVESGNGRRCDVDSAEFAALIAAAINALPALIAATRLCAEGNCPSAVAEAGGAGAAEGRCAKLEEEIEEVRAELELATVQRESAVRMEHARVARELAPERQQRERAEQQAADLFRLASTRTQDATEAIDRAEQAEQTLREAARQNCDECGGTGRIHSHNDICGCVDVPRLLREERQRRESVEQREARLRAALNELTAMVRGECPSLLNEDSGGDGALAVEIDAALAEGQDG